MIEELIKYTEEIKKEVRDYHGATGVSDKKMTIPMEIYDASSVHINGIDARPTRDIILRHKIR